MRRVCAWCKKELGTVPSKIYSQEAITHGICQECVYDLVSQRGIPLQRFLDGLDAPVLVVESDGTIMTANNKASTLVKKDLSEIEGYKGGDVFSCRYARLPEGCGNTTHCSGCTIRRTVMETFQSGKSVLRMPATLKPQEYEESQEIHFYISTEKVSDIVLLRVDAVLQEDSA